MLEIPKTAGPRFQQTSLKEGKKEGNNNELRLGRKPSFLEECKKIAIQVFLRQLVVMKQKTPLTLVIHPPTHVKPNEPKCHFEERRPGGGGGPTGQFRK